jgi:hypothetical protein
LKSEDVLRLMRRRVRYHLYRCRTAEEGVRELESDSEPFKDYFEGLEGFGGWVNFARSWDVGPEGQHDRIVARLHTEEQLWNMKLASLARPLFKK